MSYLKFTREGFEDYLLELKRRNRKNNKIDQEMQSLISGLKDPTLCIKETFHRKKRAVS